MNGARYIMCLCLVIGMTISGNSPVYSQGPSVARTISYIPPSSSITLPVANKEIRALKIGDKVPDIEFSLLNYPLKKAKLSDFAGKLVILDFWATWCTSCIRNFPKMDSLQKRFKGQVQIILLNSKSTGDNFTKVELFLDKWKSRYNSFVLPAAVMDSIADKYFSHKLIPHYVWIMPDGSVRAITSSDQITEENIKKVIVGDDIALPSKKDLDIDKPLYLSDNISVNDFTQYSIFIKGKVDGLPTGSLSRKSGDVLRGKAIINTSIINMFMTVANTFFSDFKFSGTSGISYNSKRMILEVKDTTKLIFNGAISDKVKWNMENLYTYELIVPTSESSRLYEFMFDGLNKNSNYSGKIEKRKRPCLILKRISSIDKLITKGGKPENELNGNPQYIKNLPFQQFVLWLNTISSIKIPIIDECNYSGNIDIELCYKPTDVKLEDLNTQLKRYDLELIPEEREINMLVLKEK